MNELINNVLNIRKHAIREVETYIDKIFLIHAVDNLGDMFEDALKRGFIGFEWIDFKGLYITDVDYILNKGQRMLYEFRLEHILKPFYNSKNFRLGFILSSNSFLTHIKERDYFCLPLELQTHEK